MRPGAHDGPAAVATISAAVLAYEVLLMRLFAIIQWHHFAFMIISIALLGFGVSGALLAVFRAGRGGARAAALRRRAAGFAVAAPGGFLLAQRLPFNALEIVWDAGAAALAGADLSVLVVPFMLRRRLHRAGLHAARASGRRGSTSGICSARGRGRSASSG